MHEKTEPKIVPNFPEFRWRTFRFAEYWTNGTGRLWYAWLVLALALGFIAIFASNTALYGGCDVGSGEGIQCPDAISAGLRFGAVYLGIFVVTCIATPFVAAARRTRRWVRSQIIEGMIEASEKKDQAAPIAKRLTDPGNDEFRLLDAAHAVFAFAAILVGFVIALLLFASDLFAETGGFVFEATRDGMFAQLYLHNALLLAGTAFTLVRRARHLRVRAKALHADLQAELRLALELDASTIPPVPPMTFQAWTASPTRRTPEKD